MADELGLVLGIGVGFALGWFWKEKLFPSQPQVAFVSRPQQIDDLIRID